MRAGCALAALVAAGCGDGTSLRFAISAGAGIAQPDSLRVTLYGPGLVGSSTVPVAAAGKQLPGVLVVAPLDAGLPDFRWLLDGTDALGVVRSQAASFDTLAPGRENDRDVALGAPLEDTDGDGVPDVIDDCPALADPEQRCAQAGEFGPPPDLRAVDLASSDLAGADLATRDLSTPNDLSTTRDFAGADLAGTCPANATLCEDFESGSLATHNWSVNNLGSGDSVDINMSRPHGGTRSLDCVGASLGFGHMASIANSLGQPPSFGIRLWVYSVGDPGTDSFFVQAYTATNGVSIGQASDGNWKVTEDLGSTTDDHEGTTAVPTGKWTCIELVYSQASGQRFQAYADNVLIADFAASATYGAFTDLYVGYARVPPNAATEVFVDDVAVAPARVGCP